MKPELSICALSSGDTSASKTVFRSRPCPVNLMVNKKTGGKNLRPAGCAEKNKNFWNPQITQISQITKVRSRRYFTELLCQSVKSRKSVDSPSTTSPIQVCTFPLEMDWSFFPVRSSLLVRVRNRPPRHR